MGGLVLVMAHPLDSLTEPLSPLNHEVATLVVKSGNSTPFRLFIEQNPRPTCRGVGGLAGVAEDRFEGRGVEYAVAPGLEFARGGLGDALLDARRQGAEFAL